MAWMTGFCLPFLSSPTVFSGVRVTRYLVLCVCFVDRCLSFCPFCGHSVVCPSTAIHSRWLPWLLFGWYSSNRNNVHLQKHQRRLANKCISHNKYKILVIQHIQQFLLPCTFQIYSTHPCGKYIYIILWILYLKWSP
jgi:hypothetical protein